MWAQVYKKALDAYAKARGLDPTLLYGAGQQLLRNRGDMPLQHVHRDLLVDDFPTEEECARARRYQKDRITRRSKPIKKEDPDVVELLD